MPNLQGLGQTHTTRSGSAKLSNAPQRLHRHWRVGASASQRVQRTGRALRSNAAREAVQLLSRALEVHRTLHPEQVPARSKRKGTWLDPTSGIDTNDGDFTLAAIESALTASPSAAASVASIRYV